MPFDPTGDQSAEQPMMLTEVRLERFKAAFAPDPIRLRPFNVIIGRNGSGKSTLLEALQWLDVTIRRDAREASDRYFGSSDLINLRAQIPYFRLTLRWGHEGEHDTWRYRVKVEDQDGVPSIAEEQLALLHASGRQKREYVSSRSDARWVLPGGNPEAAGRFPITEPDRLAIMRAAETPQNSQESPSMLGPFWERAVFLRLSPNRLAFGSPATRRSFEPILDEEGQTLPALLNELDSEQRAELVQTIQQVLPGIQAVEVSRSETGRDTRIHYGLLERMPFQGRAGRREFSIPAWMLSEGTRRITAIMALLLREPRPSLICIEEVENGLDPFTVRIVLRYLQSAADAGTQIIVTTHSPWLLDEVPIESVIQVRRVEGDTRYDRFIDRPEITAFDDDVPAGTRYVEESQ